MVHMVEYKGRTGVPYAQYDTARVDAQKWYYGAHKMLTRGVPFSILFEYADGLWEYPYTRGDERAFGLGIWRRTDRPGEKEDFFVDIPEHLLKRLV